MLHKFNFLVCLTQIYLLNNLVSLRKQRKNFLPKQNVASKYCLLLTVGQNASSTADNVKDQKLPMNLLFIKEMLTWLKSYLNDDDLVKNSCETNTILL